MRILRPIVLPSAAAVPMFDPKIARRGVVGSQIVRDQIFRCEAIFFSNLRINFSAAVLFRLVWTKYKARAQSAPVPVGN